MRGPEVYEAVPWYESAPGVRGVELIVEARVEGEGDRLPFDFPNAVCQRA